MYIYIYVYIYVYTIIYKYTYFYLKRIGKLVDLVTNMDLGPELTSKINTFPMVWVFFKD